MVQILYNLVKVVIGEAEDISDLVPAQLNGYEESKSEESKSESMISESIGTNEGETSNAPPFIVVLDNAHMMDPASWELYEAIRDGCYRIAIILLLQTDYNEAVKINPGSKETF